MAHSFVEFRGRNAHLKDFDIELAAYLLMAQQNVAGKSTSHPPEVDKLFDWWKRSLRSSDSGCIDLRLDEYLSSGPSARAVVELIDGAIARLRQLGEFLSADYQNQVLGEKLVFGERNTSDVITVLEKMKAVLLG
jgi:hypothetical protein